MVVSVTDEWCLLAGMHGTTARTTARPTVILLN
jgi:hypothetical protein